MTSCTRLEKISKKEQTQNYSQQSIIVLIRRYLKRPYYSLLRVKYNYNFNTLGSRIRCEVVVGATRDSLILYRVAKMAGAIDVGKRFMNISRKGPHGNRASMKRIAIGTCMRNQTLNTYGFPEHEKCSTPW